MAKPETKWGSLIFLLCVRPVAPGREDGTAGCWAEAGSHLPPREDAASAEHTGQSTESPL